MKKQKGISLIVLVITILVMIILAGVVIVSLQQSNPIQKAKFARMVDSLGSVRGAISQYAANAQAHDTVEADMKNLVNNYNPETGTGILKPGKEVKDKLGVDPTSLQNEGDIIVHIGTGRTEYKLNTDAYDEQIKESKPEGIIPSEGGASKPTSEYSQMVKNVEEVQKAVSNYLSTNGEAKLKELLKISEEWNPREGVLIENSESYNKLGVDFKNLLKEGDIYIDFKKGAVTYKLTTDKFDAEIDKNMPEAITTSKSILFERRKAQADHTYWSIDKNLLEKDMYFSFKIKSNKADFPPLKVQFGGYYSQHSIMNNGWHFSNYVLSGTDGIKKVKNNEIYNVHVTITDDVLKKLKSLDDIRIYLLTTSSTEVFNFNDPILTNAKLVKEKPQTINLELNANSI